MAPGQSCCCPREYEEHTLYPRYNIIFYNKDKMQAHTLRASIDSLSWQLFCFYRH